MSVALKRADIVVRTPLGRVSLLVEIKNREGLTAAIASYFRRNLVMHGILDTWSPDFLLIASQDRGFLWDERRGSGPDAKPDYEFLMDTVVRKYVPRTGGQDRFGHAQFEIIVASWLSDVAMGVIDDTLDATVSLTESGLADVMRGASLEVEAAR